MNEMTYISAAQFYHYDNLNDGISLCLATANGTYGEVMQEDIQSFYETADWLIAKNDNIVLNIGTNLQTWLQNYQQFYFPANLQTNIFLESKLKHSSFYAFQSVHNEEEILARYTFHKNEEEYLWDIMWLENNEEPELIQCISYQEFVNNFKPSNQDSQKYIDNIYQYHQHFLGNVEEKLTPEEIYLRLPCDCWSHEMSVNSDWKSKCIEFGYWQRGRGEDPWGWKTRIKMVFDILMTGNPFTNMLILNKANAIKLRNFLNDFIDKCDD